MYSTSNQLLGVSSGFISQGYDCQFFSPSVHRELQVASLHDDGYPSTG